MDCGYDEGEHAEMSAIKKPPADARQRTDGQDDERAAAERANPNASGD
jgi:hypothetical protein